MRRRDGSEVPNRISGLRRRRIAPRILVAILLLLLVDTAVWAFVCQRIETGLREAAAAAPQQGWTIAAETLRWGGWPLAAAVDLTGVSAEAAVPAGLLWRAERARIQIAWLHPTTLTIPIAGAQSIAAEGIPAIPLHAQSTIIRADLTGSAPVQATIGNLQATAPGGTLTLAQAELAFPPNGITADLSGLAPPGVSPPIGSIRLHVAIDPPLPISDTPETAAQAWRQAGGRITVADAVLRWAALDATGRLSLTLDEHLQPQAEGTIDAAGLPAWLDDLVQTGTLAPAQATAAKAVIALLAGPAGGKRVALPVTLQDGVLRLARFPLFRFPPLAWN